MLRCDGYVYAGIKKYLRDAALAAAAGSVLLTTAGPAAAEKPPDEVFAATTAITLSAGQKLTSFDLSFVDPVIELYFLADRTNKTVDVVDTTTNKVVTQLAKGSFVGVAASCAAGGNNCNGPNGVLTVEHKEVWAGDGDGTLKVIDLASGLITHTIPSGGAFRVNEGCYDPRDHLFLTGNAGNPNATPVLWPFLTFIPSQGPNAYKVVKTLTLNGTAGTPKATNQIDACEWSPRTGKFYVNIPEVNGPGNDTKPGAVLVISPQTMTIEDTFTIPIGVCAGPQGMALGPENQILLGCNNPNHTVPSTVIINQRSGAVIHVLADEDGSDQVWFNEGDDQFFLAEGGHLPNQQLGVVDAQTGQQDQSIVTGAGNTAATPHGTAHSVAADPIKNQVYVPIASTSGGTICGLLGGSDSQGCIAVFTTTNDDRPHVPVGPAK